MFNNHSIILASNSPRRAEILQMAGVPFTVSVAGEISENYPPGMPLVNVPLHIAKFKQEHYTHFWSKSGNIVITCDTAVILGNELLNKPCNRLEAFRMLENLSGKVHKVVSGVVLKSIDREAAFFSETDVWFKRLSPWQVEYYVDNFSPYDKAGAYGIQEWIGIIGISRVEGSFFNVMGLPIDMVYDELLKF